ncbi:MAG TPA: tRNA (adenosine(37)-N6)-dimethylallyltransferase MiaA [Candidatus Angelobacter sp.]|nr:tRNA (adenosine(37)-N6)-dimethylallyltransferase MiaA [Candidatus Angelobacter sp.]
MSEPLLVVLLGPTASGKTALSLWLAQRLQAEIVSCDSVAVYREFEIGTAKPSQEQRRLVPHHLIDVIPPDGFITAGDYSRMARHVLAEIVERRHLPIVVGGAGLYLRALLDGLFAGPPRSEELRRRLRRRAEVRGPESLHRLLQRLDPGAAARIHANDVPKVIRAIEICITARRQMTEMWRQGRDPLHGFRILRIGLDPDRETLYQRINSRAREMFLHGLVEETRTLRQRYGDSARTPASLGYKQAAQYLAGELSLEQAITAAQQGHRNYAKRQMTWFRREPDVHWLHGFGSEAQVQEEALCTIRKNLLSDQNAQGLNAEY